MRGVARFRGVVGDGHRSDCDGAGDFGQERHHASVRHDTLWDRLFVGPAQTNSLCHKFAFDAISR